MRPNLLAAAIAVSLGLAALTAGPDAGARPAEDAPAAAGQRWLYSTGETNLVGILISQATGKPLSQYLQEKVWGPVGMEQQATWILSKTGEEISGCCIQASARDYARFGQFMLNGGVAGGRAGRSALGL